MTKRKHHTWMDSYLVCIDTDHGKYFGHATVYCRDCGIDACKQQPMPEEPCEYRLEK